MKVELVGVGRRKVNETVECKNDDAILRAVSKHLMSRDISIVFDDSGEVGTIYAGMRSVGVVLCPARRENQGAERE